MPLSALLIFLGCGSGGLVRYGMLLLSRHLFPTTFPLGTLMVNISGCLLAGLLLALLTGKLQALTSGWAVFLLVGFCGGYTTFSAFSLDTLQLLQNNQWVYAIFYISASLVLCLVAAILGFWLGKQC